MCLRPGGRADPGADCSVADVMVGLASILLIRNPGLAKREIQQCTTNERLSPFDEGLLDRKGLAREGGLPQQPVLPLCADASCSGLQDGVTSLFPCKKERSRQHEGLAAIMRSQALASVYWLRSSVSERQSTLRI